MKQPYLSKFANLVFVLLTSLMLVFTANEAFSAEIATGIVFNDTNSNGIYDTGEKGIKDVRVSNGVDIVITDESGKYKMPVDEDCIIFVIKPKNWTTQFSKDNLPKFYYIHKPNGSSQLKYAGVLPTGNLPKSVDFPLYPSDETQPFKALLFGDTQTTNQTEVDYLAHDIVEELIGTDAAFGVTLGDIMNDNLSFFDSLNSTIGLIGIPWYNVMGNHDRNYDAKLPKYSNETFERIYGPSHYSFDHGDVHFIALYDVMHNPGDGGYTGGLGSEQMTFIKNDLNLVSKDKLVVLMMHIPILEIKERQEIFDILKEFPNTFSISAHYHHHEHTFLTSEHGWNGDKPHHHLINVTACGSWWTGVPDERGIPHTTMSDGAPNGYTIITFDGNTYKTEFKATRFPKEYQMNIFAPEQVKSEELSKSEVLVNVFDGSEKSKVEISYDDGKSWLRMEKASIEDPYYMIIKGEEKQTDLPGRDLPKAKKSPHIWRSSLPANMEKGKHLIHIHTTDMFGHEYVGYRIITIL